MREIRFRMWNGQIMFHDVLAGYHSVEYLVPGVGEWKRLARPECAVMQFTGLRDKNGWYVYEGDIVAYLGFTAQVCWDEQYLQWFMLWDEDSEPMNIGMQSEVEVIGNIHENPELLNEE